MQEIIKYSGCFVCGDENPEGLQIRFYHDGEHAKGEYTTEPKYQGYRGIFHGGLVATLLDEIMAKAVLARQRYCMTVEINVRFKRAIPIGERLNLTGRVTHDRGRIMETEGRLTGADESLYAVATGKYMEASSRVRHLV